MILIIFIVTLVYKSFIVKLIIVNFLYFPSTKQCHPRFVMYHKYIYSAWFLA